MQRKMKRKDTSGVGDVWVFGWLALCLCLTACSTSASQDSSSQSRSKPSDSGPITFSLSDESSAIRNAPAYDTADAKKYIDSMPEIREMIDIL